MSGNNFLLDTNIILYLLNGDNTLADLLEQKNIYLSFISELELKSFPGLDKSAEYIINEFLHDSTIIDLNQEIKNSTIKLRKKYRLKLPDSIIAATSEYLNIPLISADKDFKILEEISFVHYTF